MYALLLRFWPQIAIAACSAAVGIWLGFGIGRSGLESERTQRMEDRAACLEQQRDIAQRTAAAYSAELEAAAQRAVAAEEANRSAQARIAQSKRVVIQQTERIRDDAKPIPADCISDDLRVRINAAIRAANAASSPDR